eukprot:946555-Amphidinium_carterae.1
MKPLRCCFREVLSGQNDSTQIQIVKHSLQLQEHVQTGPNQQLFDDSIVTLQAIVCPGLKPRGFPRFLRAFSLVKDLLENATVLVHEPLLFQRVLK